MTLRLATRQSPLALVQANRVRGLLAERDIDSELVLIDTRGDRESRAELTTIGGQGVFAVEVQRAVLHGEADVAVHSAKDLPSLTPPGLVLASVPERLNASDVLVGRSLAGLGPGARVATGSPRRRALLLERRPDIEVVPLRGNMATRLARVGHDGVDAVIAALAALERLAATERVSDRLDPEWFVPQVGQGALGLEAREDDESTLESLTAIDDDWAHRALRAERAFLEELGAGCSVPAGAYATSEATSVTIRGVMLELDGAQSVRAQFSGEDPEELGRRLGRYLRDELGGGSFAPHVR
jgi:hydroxymethylbilane synthase